MVRVERILLAPYRGAPRVSVECAEARAGWGLMGDAYAGPGSRQIVLFGSDSRAVVDADGSRGLCYPRFRENLQLDGTDLRRLRPGSRVLIGTVVLEVSRARKRCRPECELPRTDCVIRNGSAFCTVVVGGEICVGSSVDVANP